MGGVHDSITRCFVPALHERNLNTQGRFTEIDPVTLRRCACNRHKRTLSSSLVGIPVGRINQPSLLLFFLQPEQRIAVGMPCIVEAAGACDLHEAGVQSEIYACDAICDHTSDGNVERCVVSSWSCALLFALAGLAVYGGVN